MPRIQAGTAGIANTHGDERPMILQQPSHELRGTILKMETTEILIIVVFEIWVLFVTALFWFKARPNYEKYRENIFSGMLSGL